MNPEEELAQFETEVKAHFGAWTRYRNDCVEQGARAVENKIAIAKAVLRDPDRGVAGHVFECQRQRRLGWSD